MHRVSRKVTVPECGGNTNANTSTDAVVIGPASSGANPVLGKLSALLECSHRPLKAGESPKRRGQTTVYKASGRINAEIRNNEAAMENLRRARVTVKHDG